MANIKAMRATTKKGNKRGFHNNAELGMCNVNQAVQEGMGSSIPIPNAFVDPNFPAFEKNDFQIVETKTFSSMLTIAYCAIRRGVSSKLWGFCIGTPTCLVEKIYAKQDMGTTHDRFLLTPDYYNASAGTDFGTFLDHIEGCSERISQVFLENGFDISHWKSPIRNCNGIVQGLIVKVRTPILGDKIRNTNGPVRCVIKLSCVFFTPDKSGLCFEVIDVYAMNDTPTPPITEPPDAEMSVTF